MRISDWSSNVCSSDLEANRGCRHAEVARYVDDDSWCAVAGAGLRRVQPATATAPGAAARTAGQYTAARCDPGADRPGEGGRGCGAGCRSAEHTSELQSLMRISYAVFCLKKNKTLQDTTTKR